jgi:photosystem II stability/assembly factor-like uncharacterized protein
MAGLVLSVVLGAPATPDAGVWVSRGPEGGTVWAVVVHRDAPGTVYVATNRGVFKRTANDPSWHPSSVGLPHGPVDALETSCEDSETLYAALSSGGLYGTENGGATWTALDIGEQVGVAALACDPHHPATVYATTEDGILKTTDAGKTWRVLGRGLPDSVPESLVVDASIPDVLYAGAFGRGIFKSVDGGRTWVAVNSGLSNLDVQTIAVDHVAPGTVYAGTEGGGVFRTTNGGDSWEQLPTFASRVFSLAADPNAAGHVYAGTFFSGVFKSTDGGATWASANTGITGSTGVYALAIDPTVAGTIWAGMLGGGVFKSSNGAASWQATNAGFVAGWVETLAIDSTRPGTLYAATMFGGTFKTSNGGLSWTDTGLVDARALAIHPSDPNVIYASLFRSIDGGVSWSGPPGLLSSFVDDLAVHPTDPDTAYAAIGDSGVFKTSDGAHSWNRLNLGIDSGYIENVAVDPSRPDTVYAGTVGGLLKTEDGGARWRVLAAGMPAPLPGITALALDPQQPDTLYVRSWLGVQKTTDRGESWTEANAGLSGFEPTILVMDPSRRETIYASTSAGVFRSVDGGAFWRAVQPNPPEGIRSLIVDPTRQGTLYAGTLDAGAFEFVPVCGDGIVDPGEECDDATGGTTDDECRPDCRCTGGDADGDSACDVEDNCPGVSNAGQHDSDSDAVGDACDQCSSAERPRIQGAKLVVAGLQSPTGDRTVRLKGKIYLSALQAFIDPANDGMRLLLVDAAGEVVLSLNAPPGLDWQRHRKRAVWKYRATLGDGARLRFVVTIRGSGRQRISFKALADGLTFPESEVRTVVGAAAVFGKERGAAQKCGEIEFGTALQAPGCSLGRNGRKFRCR